MQNVMGLQVTTYQTFGRWCFKHQMERESNFSIYLITTQTLLNHLMSKEGLGFRHLDNQTHYVCVQWEHLLIMLLLESTGLDSSLEKNLNAHVMCILSNQGDTFSTIAADSTAIGIWEGTLSATLSCFWKLTQMCLLFLAILTLLA